MSPRGVLASIEHAIYSVGAVFLLLIRSLGSLLTLRFDSGVFLDQLDRMGAGSMAIVAMVNIFTGSILSLQLTKNFMTYGATQYVGMGVALVIARELGPVLTGVVMAGRVGSSIASELGTMVVTEQVDALRALSISPTSYLVAPRMLACMAMVPALTLVSGILAVLAGYYVANQMGGVHWKTYFGSIQAQLKMYDVAVGMLKATVFGATVAAVGCFRGLDTKGGARGVGEATTGSVVASIVLIFFLNLVMTWLFF